MNNEQTVKSKSTEDLTRELQFKRQSLCDYLDQNPDSFIEIDLKELWHKLIADSGMTKFDIINKADFGYAYFYDVINGRKIPSRDKVVRLILAMHLTLADCQLMLKFSGHSVLYPRIKRDSILIYVLSHGLSILETQKLLTAQGLGTLK